MRAGGCQAPLIATATRTPAALKLAHDLGVEVRVRNPRGGTFPPKLYAARRDDQVSVVVGSANLTGGLVTNVELATRLTGEMREPKLAFAFEWARGLLRHADTVPWEPHVAVDEEAPAPPPCPPVSHPLYSPPCSG